MSDRSNIDMIDSALSLRVNTATSVERDKVYSTTREALLLQCGHFKSGYQFHTIASAMWAIQGRIAVGSPQWTCTHSW